MENPFEILNDIRNEQAAQRVLIEQLLTPANHSEETLLTQKEAYEWARTTESTWIKWRNKGKIPYKKLGGRYLYNKKDISDAITKMKGGYQIMDTSFNSKQPNTDPQPLLSDFNIVRSLQRLPSLSFSETGLQNLCKRYGITMSHLQRLISESLKSQG